MTGLEIFIGGGILVCNAILAGYLVGSSKKSKDSQNDIQVSEPEFPQKETSEVSESPSVSTVSGFDVDKFIAELGEKFIAEIPKILAGSIGEVPISEVEFADDTPETTSEQNTGSEGEKNARMDEETAMKALETDYRDIDDFPPSEPLSSGASIDELEEAVDVTLNDNASEEEKIKAGQVLQEYKRSQLFDSITANERIGKRVDLCVKLAIRAQISSPREKGKDKKLQFQKAKEGKLTPDTSSKSKKQASFNPEAYLNGSQS